jgi:hypothetical protein
MSLIWSTIGPSRAPCPRPPHQLPPPSRSPLTRPCQPRRAPHPLPPPQGRHWRAPSDCLCLASLERRRLITPVPRHPSAPRSCHSAYHRLVSMSPPPPPVKHAASPCRTASPLYLLGRCWRLSFQDSSAPLVPSQGAATPRTASPLQTR